MISVNQLCRSRLFCPCFCSCTLGALAGAGAGRGAVAIAAGASEGFVGLPLGCSACNTEGGRSGDTGRCWPKLFWLGRCGGPCLAVWPGGITTSRWGERWEDMWRHPELVRAKNHSTILYTVESEHVAWVSACIGTWKFMKKIWCRLHATWRRKTAKG